MSRDDPNPAGPGGAGVPGARRSRALAFVLLALAGTIVAGRLAMDAWLERSVPQGLPRIGGTPGPARPLLVAVVDGLREQSLWDEPSALPWLKGFAREGAGGVARAGNPTLTAACVRTLLTGQWPDLMAGLKNFDAAAVEGSWVEFLRERGARPAHGGDAAIAQLCRPHLVPEDVLAFPDRGPVDQGQCDAEAVPFVLDRIAKGCDLVTLHVTAPDHAGHKHGAVGEPYRQACLGVDAALRKVVEAFRARHPDATVLVAADHGVSPHGTHGGGEPSAQRAPFVLVGPGVARRLGVEVPQAALAPTLCTLLGLPQPPLAQSPPARELLALPADVVLRALDAHVQARAWVARAVGNPAVGPIERKRAEVAVRKMGEDAVAQLEGMSVELDALAAPTPGFAMALVLALALAGLAALVGLGPWLARTSPAVGWALGAACLLLVALTPFPGARLWAAGGVAAVALGLSLVLLARDATGGPAVQRGRVLASVLALPLLLCAWDRLRNAEERDARWTWIAPIFAVGVILLSGWLAWRRSSAGPRATWRERLEAAGLPLLALVGALVGAYLSLRPMLDPFIPVTTILTLLALGAVGLALRSRPLAQTSPRLRAALFVGTALFLLVPRIASTRSGSWVQALPLEGLGWALAALVGVFAFAWWFRTVSLRGLGGAVLLAAFALLTSWWGSVALTRQGGAAGVVGWIHAFGPQVLGLAALALAARADASAHATFGLRLMVALAWARRLTASDAEVAAFTAFVLLAAFASRLPAVLARVSWPALALLLLALRVGAFYALGGVDSFSTIDVGAGFRGLEVLGQHALPTEGQGMTLPVAIATLQVMLRFALPWLVLFALARRLGATRVQLRAVALGLTLAFAARASALLLMLWAFDPNAWWVDQANTLYALGAADIVLLLAMAVLTGAAGATRLQPDPARTIIPA